MSRNRLRVLLHAVAHTRPRQLRYRLQYMLKRRLAVRLPGLLDARPLADPAEVPSLRGPMPLPVFPPRREFVREHDGEPSASFHGHEVPLRPPIDWHTDAFAYGAHLALMHLHYTEYLEAVDDRVFRAVVEDWIAANRPYGRGYWLYSWNSFSVSVRIVVWMQQLASRGIDPSSPTGTLVLRSVFAQTRFLERNLELDLGGNHLLRNVKALLWAGRVFGGDDGDRWRAIGVDLLRGQLDEQILRDGLHYERSPAYHCQVFADLLECFAALDPGPARVGLGKVLDRMAQVLADLTHPDGRISLFNDGGLSMAYAPETCLSAYTAMTGRRVHARRHFSLEISGYHGVRDGDDLVVIDCGPIAPDFLPAHGHGDVLAFEWSVDGRRVVVDTGVFEYAPGAARHRSRSTMAHNTVTVDDEDQGEFWSSFRVGRRPRVTVRGIESGPTALIVEGSHDGFGRQPGAPIHARRFRCSPRRIEVADEVSGGAGQAVRARLLLGPEFTVAPGQDGARITDGSVAVVLRTDVPWSVVDAPWYPDFGVRVETSQIVMEYGPAPCRGGFVLEAERSQHRPDRAGVETGES